MKSIERFKVDPAGNPKKRCPRCRSIDIQKPIIPGADWFCRDCYNRWGGDPKKFREYVEHVKSLAGEKVGEISESRSEAAKKAWIKIRAGKEGKCPECGSDKITIKSGVVRCRICKYDSEKVKVIRKIDRLLSKKENWRAMAAKKAWRTRKARTS